MAPTTRKRSYEGDEIDQRPPKLQKNTSGKPNGLEASGILDDISPKALCGANTKTDHVLYQQRGRISTHMTQVKHLRKKANRIPSSSKKMPASSQKGMSNFKGVLCYRHSLFQALFHAPKVVGWLQAHRSENCMWGSITPCIACVLRGAVEVYYSVDSAAMTRTLKEVHEVFKRNNWSWPGQADPDEQLTWLMGRMRENLPAQEFGILDASHQLILNSSIVCTACKHKSTKYGDTEGSLSVELRPRIRNGTLSDYVHNSMVSTVEDYRCEKCNNKSDKERIRLISFSPDCLLIQLKRFDPLGRKDVHPVPFSTSISLNKYRTPHNKANSVYELSGVVSHTGSVSSGHYTCHAKGTDNNWKLFDDSRVSSCLIKDVLQPSKAWTPYLLFFQRKRK